MSRLGIKFGSFISGCPCLTIGFSLKVDTGISASQNFCISNAACVGLRLGGVGHIHLSLFHNVSIASHTLSHDHHFI